jgi:integrase
MRFSPGRLQSRGHARLWLCQWPTGNRRVSGSIPPLSTKTNQIPRFLPCTSRVLLRQLQFVVYTFVYPKNYRNCTILWTLWRQDVEANNVPATKKRKPGLSDKLHTHSLRHSFASVLLRRGCSIKAVQ